MSENETDKRPRKLTKGIEGTVVSIEAIGGSLGNRNFDFAALPPDIQAKLGPFGLGHKLGDAAAGKTGSEAEESITKVWEGLMAGDWSVKAPATPRVSVKALLDKVSSLPAGTQQAAKELLASLGIEV
jgi:hypothetical protein